MNTRLTLLLILSGACTSTPVDDDMYDVVSTESRDTCAERSPTRNAYWGDTHVHTLLSFDAYTHDVRVTPEDAYRFAQGEEVFLPPLDIDGVGTQRVQLDRPLDFTAVTDHAEFLGETAICGDPDADGYSSTQCGSFRQGTGIGTFTFGRELGELDPDRFSFCGDDDRECLDRADSIWERIQQAAEDAYDRADTCDFTSFVGYEWSGAPDLSNLHRNVIFRNADVPAVPTTYYEEPTADGLFRALESSCTGDCDVLSIPHNSNLSNGQMFRAETFLDRDERRERAERRARLEPLVEVFQHKAGSECMNGLADPFGAPDELCDFEKYHRPPIDDCGDVPGEGGLAGFGCVHTADFVRNALVIGLQEQAAIGVNPFKLGLSAATDTHNGTPGLVSERTWPGHTGMNDGPIERRLDGPTLPIGSWRFNPGGLTGVWAQENSRDGLFMAMERREVWGTSGPRIAVRFFGGWDLPDELCADAELVARGYELGVPMGRDLPEATGDTPSFVVSALRDPGTDVDPGAPLAQVDIIKGWLDSSGNPRLEVFTITSDGGDFETDADSCASTGSGADSLCAVWRDPQPNLDQPAFYYARVVEFPTCRWNAHTCNTLAEPRPEACSDPDVPRLLQERAWTSPIWFNPAP